MKIYTNSELENRKNKKEKINNSLKLIVILIITIGIIYNITLIIQSMLYPNKIPSFLGYKTFSIISGSMIPAVNVGDIVIVNKIDPNKLKVGDIISFRSGSQVITHRIDDIEKNEQEILYITKGDNNNTRDSEKVNEKNLEGKVVKIVPKIGNIIFLLKDKITILFIILIFIVSYMCNIKKSNKRLVREEKKKLLNIKRK